MRTLKSGYKFLVVLVTCVVPLLSLSEALAQYPAPVIKASSVYAYKMPDGSFGTRFLARLSGPSPEDISSFTVTGPSGTFDLLPATTSKESGLIYGHTIPDDIIDNGNYLFVLTDSFSRTHSVVKNFTHDNTVPGIDSSGMTPQNQTYVGTTTPTLSFNGVSGGDFYYRVYVVDYTSKVTYYMSPITQQTSFTVPSGLLQPNSPYWWFVRVWDRENDPQNVVESERRSFFTGTKGDPSSSEIYMASIDQSNTTLFLVRNTPVAPWDISQLTVTDPNSNVYGFQNSLRCWMNEPARYQIFVGDPFPMPDGVYTFVIKADVGDPVTKEHTFSYAPVPLVSEASRDPNENHYFSTKTPTFSWDPVGGAGIYYRLFIYDYVHDDVLWYKSPWSTSTSLTVPESADLPTGSSYKWRIFVYDGNTSESLNNLSVTTRRTFTMSEPIKGDINFDGKVDLKDATLGLQLAAAISPSTIISRSADVNGDERIGIAESVYDLQKIAGLRNEPPLLVLIGNKTVDEGTILTFSISAEDPEGDTLTFSAAFLPNGATFDPNTRTFSWTPTYSQSGTHDVSFTVTDSYNNSDSETVTIIVNNVLALEDWDYTLDGVQGNGSLTLAEQQDGSITVDGSWGYGPEITVPHIHRTVEGFYSDCPVTIDGSSVSFTCQGSASNNSVPPEYPEYMVSSFTLTFSGTLNNGQGSGTYTLTFSNPAWPPMFSGNVVANRTSGGGITQ
jgi:hypothetical protein